MVDVVPLVDDDRDLALQYQIETSMTIMDEGPHIDLVDWKHYTSDWIDLERIDARRFRLPKIESNYELASRFPTYTVDELYEAAMATGGHRWADLARKRMETLFTLHISVPMGC